MFVVVSAKKKTKIVNENNKRNDRWFCVCVQTKTVMLWLERAAANIAYERTAPVKAEKETW